jgi:hypothetical protein
MRRYYAVIAKFITLADSADLAKRNLTPFQDGLENVVQGIPLTVEAREATAAEIQIYGIELPKHE